jgi:uncharacterized membrane protein YbhN (UPF0104 family)
MAEAATMTGILSKLRPFTPGSEVGLALGVVALLSVLILPLPTCCAISGWRCRSPPPSSC